MTCESYIQIIQPTVQPTITQCIQVVQAVPTIVPPDSINVLIGGVQQVTYYSNDHFIILFILFMIIAAAVGVAVGMMVGSD